MKKSEADDIDYTVCVLLDYLESYGDLDSVEELVSCLLADSAVEESADLRRSLEAFGVILGAQVEV